MSCAGLLLAFAAGCAATLVLTRPAATVHAQGGTITIHVCAAADGVLRQTAGPCLAGQQSLNLSASDTPPATTTNGQPDAAAVDVLRRKLADLEARVRNLESSGKGAIATSVVAPFKVVDRKGVAIFSVDEHGAYVYNSAGTPVAEMTNTSGTGGSFVARSTTNGRNVWMGADAERAGVKVNDASDARVDLGFDHRDAGTYTLTFYTADGHSIAGIGESRNNSGGIAVVFGGGIEKAQISSSSEGKGIVEVLGKDGWRSVLAQLTEGANSEGRLQLFSKSGELMVEAGGTAEGIGVVRAGPEAFKPGYGVLGLPGSYLAGKR
jgi:hypothetical protein